MLSREVRLRSGRDFRAVYSRSKSWSTPRIVLALRQWKSGRPEFMQPTSSNFRFGFSISKKTAKKAHDRNKIKRRLREIVRLRILPQASATCESDIIVTVRPPALALTFEELAMDVEKLFKDAGLI